MNLIYNSALLFLLALILVACEDTSALSPEAHLEQAELSYQDGKLNDSAIHLRSVLQKDPESAKARWLLGSVYLEMGNALSAEKELLYAQGLGVSDDAVIPLLARALLEQQKYQKTLSLEPSASISDTSSAQLLSAKAAAFLALRKTENAKRMVELALSRKSDSPEALVTKASLLASNGDFPTAIKTLDQVLAQQPKFAAAWSLRGDIHRHLNEFEMAESDYTNAEKNRFNNKGDILKRAKLRIDMRLLNKAQEDIDKIEKFAATHPGIRIAQGMILFHKKRLEEARTIFEDVLGKNPNLVDAVYYLGTTNYLLGAKAQASEQLNRYLRFNPSNAQTRVLLAIMNYEDGKYEEAESLIRPVVSANKDNALALTILANSLLKQKNSAEAIQLLIETVELLPESAYAQTNLAKSYFEQGDMSTGIEQIQAALEKDPHYQAADIVLITQLLLNKSYDEALTAARNFQARNPKDSTPRTMIGLIHLMSGDQEAARRELEKAILINPSDVDATRFLAVLDLKNRNTDSARSRLEALLEHHPDNLEALIRLAAISRSAGNAEEEVSLLEKAIKAHPKEAAPRLLLANHYLSSGNPEKVPAVLGELMNNPSENPMILLSLGQSQLARNLLKDAKVTLSLLVRQQPNSATAHYLLARAYDGLGEQSSMRQHINKALELDPTHQPSLLALAYLNMAQSGPASIVKDVERLKELSPHHPDVLKLEAAIASHEGNNGKAVQIYKELLNRTPKTSHMILLANQQWKNGDHSASLHTMETWVEQHSDDITALAALADRHSKLGHTEEVLRIYEKILEISPNNALALNNVAWLSLDSDPQKALRYAEKAYDIAAKSTRVIDTYSMALLKNGEPERALRLLEKALESNPLYPSFLYHKALGLEAMGKTEEALEITTFLLDEQRHDFPERASVQQLQQRLN